jgi:hypothetical protein
LGGNVVGLHSKPFHIGVGIHECNGVLEVNDAVGLGNTFDPDIEIIESVFEYQLNALVIGAVGNS